MYFVFSDSGELLEEYESLEGALSCASVFPKALVLYHQFSRDAWDHGIEIGTPNLSEKEYIYWMDWARHSSKYSAKTLEQALEGLKRLSGIQPNPIDYGIEERITTTYKVKL